VTDLASDQTHYRPYCSNKTSSPVLSPVFRTPPNAMCGKDPATYIDTTQKSPYTPNSALTSSITSPRSSLFSRSSSRYDGLPTPSTITSLGTTVSNVSSSALSSLKSRMSSLGSSLQSSLGRSRRGRNGSGYTFGSGTTG